MKKLFTVLLLAVMSVAAHAQFYMGGTLGLGVESSFEDGDSSSSTSGVYSFAPEAGYIINKTWAVGATLGIQYMNLSSTDVTTISVLPYVRGTFARAGIFDFFGEFTLGYAHRSVEGYGASGFAIGLRPGFIAHFNDKFGLVAKTTLFKYNYFDGLNTVGFSFNNGVEMGVQFTF